MRITPNADESDFFKPALIQLLSSPVPLSTFLTVLSISKDVESKELNKLLVNGIIDVISISPTQHSIAQVDDFFNLRNLEQFMEYSLEWSRISDKSTDF
jgi:hypothetical protein